MKLVHRCAVCDTIIHDDEDFVEGRDDPDLCELCQEVTADGRPQ